MVQTWTTWKGELKTIDCKDSRQMTNLGMLANAKPVSSVPALAHKQTEFA